MPLTTGSVLVNRYRAVQPMRQEAPGTVYRGWDLNLQIRCAIKEIAEFSEENSRRFPRDELALGNFKHPNLARITDHFFVPNQGEYLVMDFIEGEDLEALLSRSGPIPEEALLPWIGQVADALDFLHNQSPPVIHHAVRPCNIRITPEGRAVLVGFGALRGPGAAAATPQTDINALGAAMYELMTGQPPQSGQNPADMPTPSMLNPNASQRTSWVVMKALEPDPKKNFATVLEFKRALNVPLSAGGAAAMPGANVYAQPPSAPARPPAGAPLVSRQPPTVPLTIGTAGKSGAARGGKTNTSQIVLIAVAVGILLCIGLIAAAIILLRM